MVCSLEISEIMLFASPLFYIVSRLSWVAINLFVLYNQMHSYYGIKHVKVQSWIFNFNYF